MYMYGRIDNAPNPRGVVLIAHGYAEHCGRYDEITRILNNHGLTVFRYDHYGHGKSSGPRARVDVNALLRQHYRARKQVREYEPDLPLFLMGHSMGGLITVASTLTQPDDIAGVVLTGPALGVQPALPAPLVDGLYEISKLASSLPIMPFGESEISRDPNVVQNYMNDPLNYIGPVQMLTGVQPCQGYF